MEQKEKVLEIKDLVVQFKAPNRMHYDALKGISFDIYKNEIFGLIGESGSGKSTTAKAILGLVDHSSGSIKINGEFVPAKSSKVRGQEQVRLAKKVQMIFQDAKSSLNPRETVYQVVVEGAKNLKLHRQVIANEKLINHGKWLDVNNEATSFNAYIKAEYDFEFASKKIYDEYDPQIWSAYRKLEDVQYNKTARVREIKTEINSLNTQYQIDKYNIAAAKRANKSNEEELEKIKAEGKDYLSKRKKVLDAKVKVLKEELKEAKQSSVSSKEEITTLKGKISDLKKTKNEAISSEKDKLKTDLSSINKDERHDEQSYEYKEMFGTNSDNVDKGGLYKKLVSEALQKVSISPENLNRYPQEFSGGQAQRIAIARTLMTNSKFVIADEPISALDVSIQAQVINILKGLVRDEDMTIMFIAHDLQVVKYISDRIAVLYKGELVEKGASLEVYNNPVHPYTKMLINSVPKINDPDWMEKAESYVPDRFDDLLGEEHQKEWFDVNENHQVFGHKDDVEKWMSIETVEEQVTEDDKIETTISDEISIDVETEDDSIEAKTEEIELSTDEIDIEIDEDPKGGENEK